MDLLRKSLAPISADIWEEIEDQAREVFRNTLTARQVVDISGPHGFSYNALPLGRLQVPAQESDVKYGIYQVMPLVEARVEFVLSRWELDNLARGARDPDLDPVIAAAQKLAAFEEALIYNGLPVSGVAGLLAEAAAVRKSGVPSEAEQFIACLANDIETLRAHGISGPYSLVINPQKWLNLVTQVKGYPLAKLINAYVTGKVILSPAVPGMIVLSVRGGDFELTLGQDLSIGYNSHDKENIAFFITESLTFRVIEPKALITYPA